MKFRGTQKWNIGIINKPIEYIPRDLKNLNIDWFPISKISGFIADPFPIKINDNIIIFVEEFSFRENKGKISYLKYPEDFQEGRLKTAFEKSYHISYPYMFEYDRKIYSTPEMGKSNEVRLYKIKNPNEWKLEKTLISDTKGVDPTLIKYKDLWWLFFTKLDDSPYTNLHIWYSSNLTGPYHPHEENPVKSDITSSRPAGKPWVMNGELYRPAQYCLGEYGKKIIINKVEKVTPATFHEKKFAEIKPRNNEPFPKGRHTISYCKDITLIDGHKHIFNPYSILNNPENLIQKFTLKSFKKLLS